MLLMNEKNIKDILTGHKTMTLRPLRKNNKGYCKINSTHQIKNTLFSKCICTVRIINREFININELTLKDLKQLGYNNKEEYLKEAFNLKNPSNKRVKYVFEVINRNN